MSTARVAPHKNSWATGAYYKRIMPVPDGPTEFEQLVEKRGLTNNEPAWRFDTKLRAFARAHRKTRYIPESFLVALGLDAEVEL